MKVNRESPRLYGDERSLVVAFARSYGLCFSPLPETYSGREAGASSASFLITHQSVGIDHGKRQSLSGWLKDRLRIP
jgi:hypothetical protein